MMQLLARVRFWLSAPVCCLTGLSMLSGTSLMVFVKAELHGPKFLIVSAAATSGASAGTARSSATTLRLGQQQDGDLDDVDDLDEDVDDLDDVVDAQEDTDVVVDEAADVHGSFVESQPAGESDPEVRPPIPDMDLYLQSVPGRNWASARTISLQEISKLRDLERDLLGYESSFDAVADQSGEQHAVFAVQVFQSGRSLDFFLLAKKAGFVKDFMELDTSKNLILDDDEFYPRSKKCTGTALVGKSPLCSCSVSFPEYAQLRYCNKYRHLLAGRMKSRSFETAAEHPMNSGTQPPASSFQQVHGLFADLLAPCYKVASSCLSPPEPPASPPQSRRSGPSTATSHSQT
ncbi:unnamed protein product [Amoebophrya sp. A120]|nr:unnamed protein product [Amoebophrya sp. A120]|eukprot:GSA120T00006106001.1